MTFRTKSFMSKSFSNQFGPYFLCDFDIQNVGFHEKQAKALYFLKYSLFLVIHNTMIDTTLDTKTRLANGNSGTACGVFTVKYCLVTMSLAEFLPALMSNSIVNCPSLVAMKLADTGAIYLPVEST